MTFSAQTLLREASTTLQDVDRIRWDAPELVQYLNDGIKVLVTKRPDASPKKAEFVPATGARQALPAEAVAFIDVIGNSTGSQRAITKVDIALLNAFNRDWQSGRPSAVARHFCFDQRDPRTFYLDPPSNGAGRIDLLYSVFPDDLPDDSATVPLNAQWRGALLNYVLGRAYAKDAEYGGNAAAAAAYMGAFASDIGEQLQSSTAVVPTS